MSWRGVIEEFRSHLPLDTDVPAITLLEGGTPLIEAPRLCDALSISGQLYLKYEAANPTGSFKDRGMTVAISAAVANGANAVICASTGNTSASAAAYAARAGIRALVVIPEGKIALGKLAQAMTHGATVVSIDGGFDEALEIVTELARQCNLIVVNSINPLRIQGQKTAAFEVCNELGQAPDYHFLPVGNAGNITAYWMGYQEYHQNTRINSLPKMMGFQAEGAAPIVLHRIVPNPDTVATAIRIGNPASWKTAERARDESGGVIESVTDDEIMEAYGVLARTEGIFAEPASAAGIAGLKKLAERGQLMGPATVVCTLTGHGLKDPTTATNLAALPLKAPPKVDAVRDLLGI